jgi:hypothetical protein
MNRNKRNPNVRPRTLRWLNMLAAGFVLAFAIAIVLRPLPNYDIWWMLAVGRRIVETGAFIYKDPFTFTVAGAPWSPQSYASAILFFALFKAGGMVALAALRVLLVGAMTALTLRTVRRSGADWAVASPLVVVMLVNSHSRFTDRGQLFEYVFIAWLVGFLLTSHERRGKSYYALPVAIQLLWVQLHSSFLLGPALAGIFFASEWIAQRIAPTHALHDHDWKRVRTLVLLLVLACVVNPNPRAFLVQPFDPAQRELLARYTLEWKSPFDPAIAAGNFHPYYEILLGVAALAVILRITTLPLAPAALLAATAYLSLQSHRFRVEFAIVAVPMIAVLLGGTSLTRRLRASRTTWAAVGVAVALALMGTERDRALVSHDNPGLYPDAALDFVTRENIAHRPFHSIGFGSYMLWHLYGARQTFIDGRNFNLPLHRDFLAAQRSEAGLRAVTEKYRLDSFILPSIARSGAGLQDIHQWLDRHRESWPLVYADDCAFVYVATESVDSLWLDAHAIRR